MTKIIARWISQHPKTVILIATLLLIPSIFGYIKTTINYDILTYLPEKLDSVKGERILDETFNDAAMAMLIVKDGTPLDAQSLKNTVAKIDGVQQVLWVDSLADITIPKEMLPDILSSVFYSADGTSTMMMVQFKEGGSSTSTMNALREIRKAMTANCYMSGLSAITLDTKDLADAQAPIYIAIAVALALIVLMCTMNSFVLPLVVLVSLGYAIVYNMGTNIMFGSISYITQCIAAILQLGVTMDFSVFLIDRFEEEKPKHATKAEAMESAIQYTFVSLLGSSLTTVFGFLALCFMQFTLGKDIGLVMAKGVFLGLITVVTVLPAFVLLFDKPIHKTSHKSIVPSFSKLNGFLLRHKRVVAVIFILLFIPAVICQNKMAVYYDMTQSLPQDMSSVESLAKLKEEFNMATTHFVIFDENMSSDAVNEMTKEIQNIDGINTVISVDSIVGSVIPKDSLPDEIKKICVSNGYQLMMINSEYSTATDELNAQVDTLKATVRKYSPSAYITGEGVLTKDLIDVTNDDFVLTDILSTASIFLLIAICFKSVSIPAILVLSIELAIMLNKSCSFFFGSVEPFIAPTIIGCVQLGATVDYSLLMATRFREELSRGRTKEEAVKITADESSRSVFQSAAVFFVATFGVYLTCDISIVKSICLMLARGSLISAAVIICCLPSVLCLCEGIIRKTTFGWRSGGKAVNETAAADTNTAVTEKQDVHASETAKSEAAESTAENVTDSPDEKTNESTENGVESPTSDPDNETNSDKTI